MFKIIKKIFGKFANTHPTSDEEDVWTVEAVVQTMLNIGVGDRRRRHNHILPLREVKWDYKNSEDYMYLRLLSALRAFKGERDWEKYNEYELIGHMISEGFSDEKKNKFLVLLGELNSSMQYTINNKDIYHVGEREDMIRMLLEFIYAARTFEKAWNGYSAFGYGGSVIWAFLNRSSIKYINGPLEKAFDIICVLLGDDYDKPIPTSELRERYDYPSISNQDLGDMWYEEQYC